MVLPPFSSFLDLEMIRASPKEISLGYVPLHDPPPRQCSAVKRKKMKDFTYVRGLGSLPQHSLFSKCLFSNPYIRQVTRSQQQQEIKCQGGGVCTCPLEEHPWIVSTSSFSESVVDVDDALASKRLSRANRCFFSNSFLQRMVFLFSSSKLKTDFCNIGRAPGRRERERDVNTTLNLLVIYTFSGSHLICCFRPSTQTNDCI